MGQGGTCSLFRHLLRVRNSFLVFQSTSPLQDWGPGASQLSRDQKPNQVRHPVNGYPRKSPATSIPQAPSSPGRRLSCLNLSLPFVHLFLPGWDRLLTPSLWAQGPGGGSGGEGLPASLHQYRHISFHLCSAKKGRNFFFRKLI